MPDADESKFSFWVRDMPANAGFESSDWFEWGIDSSIVAAIATAALGQNNNAGCAHHLLHTTVLSIRFKTLWIS